MAVEDHIRWMWENDGSCWKLSCLLYIVGPQFNVSIGGSMPGIPTFRGPRSPHACVAAAIDEMRKGNYLMAIAWLQAGQLHNPGAQREIAENSSAAINYINSL